jgi:hypothetical protein
VNKLVEQAAFAWWVLSTLKKRNHIVVSIQATTKKHDNKFCLEIPKTVKRVLETDQETGHDLWRKALKKEMHHVSCAFNILPEGAPEPRILKHIPCHMIFDIKMDFTRKAHFVAGGHVTNPPTSMNCSSVVAHDNVCLAFFIEALNYLIRG